MINGVDNKTTNQKLISRFVGFLINLLTIITTFVKALLKSTQKYLVLTIFKLKMLIKYTNDATMN